MVKSTELQTQPTSSTVLASQIRVVSKSDEPRMDSRLVASLMGIQVGSLHKLIERHKENLLKFGSLRFQIQAKKRKKGATAEKYVLLNELQLLSITQNVRGKDKAKIELFRVELIKAFGFKRRCVAIRVENLPDYHLSRSSLAIMDNFKPYHLMNLAKIENKFIGVSSNQRGSLSEGQLISLAIVQKMAITLFTEILNPSEALRELKRRLEQLAQFITPKTQAIRR